MKELASRWAKKENTPLQSARWVLDRYGMVDAEVAYQKDHFPKMKEGPTVSNRRLILDTIS